MKGSTMLGTSGKKASVSVEEREENALELESWGEAL
jgi:hypothetical protein